MHVYKYIISTIIVLSTFQNKLCLHILQGAFTVRRLHASSLEIPNMQCKMYYNNNVHTCTSNSSIVHHDAVYTYINTIHASHSIMCAHIRMFDHENLLTTCHVWNISCLYIYSGARSYAGGGAVAPMSSNFLSLSTSMMPPFSSCLFRRAAISHCHRLNLALARNSPYAEGRQLWSYRPTWNISSAWLSEAHRLDTTNTVLHDKERPLLLVIVLPVPASTHTQCMYVRYVS